MSAARSRSETAREERTEQGFTVYSLISPQVRISVVPELGAKVISLRHAGSGREWMWHPRGGLKLFRNRAGDGFSLSPLAGLDECLPTIAPCRWRGRALPDHGEAWNVPWELDQADWGKRLLTTRVRLGLTPFELERSIKLLGAEIGLAYCLRNRGSAKEDYLWAMHPLIRLQAADRLELPLSTQSLLPGPAWTKGALASAVPEGECAKLFLNPLCAGSAKIENPETGDSLEFSWNPTENSTLGLWLTRGGWNGHEHFALEPTNGEPDALDIAAARQRCGTVSAGGSVTWQVRLRLND